jgi:hypothetical protein
MVAHVRIAGATRRARNDVHVGRHGRRKPLRFG